jgi:hypothetical protein
MSNLALTTPAHDKDTARDFLAVLDPSASRFTFQFFSDGADRYAEIFHGTLDEVWSKVHTLNTPQRGVGVFVTINETDFRGRRGKNIVRTRALFVDADSDEQVVRCLETFKAHGATPSIAVKSGRGVHFYFCTDVPCNEFSKWQESLINKVGTDPAVKDLSRVMRLPGTLHLKDPTKPRLVKLYRGNKPRRWNLPELGEKLGLSPTSSASGPSRARCRAATFAPAGRDRLQRLFGHLPVESLSEGLEANIEEIRSAVSAISPSAISNEPGWMRFARGLAHEAAVYKDQAEQLWEILNTASRHAPGYNEEDNRTRWLRYIGEALNREHPITIATVFDLAKQHGWQGWSPPMTAIASVPTVWAAADLKVSFSNIPHRQWLYGFDLVRGETTVIASPGGVGKSSLAIGMAVSIASGKGLLGEKVRGGDDLTVLLINAEDSGTEIMRRVWAFYLAHAREIAGWNRDRLYVVGADDARVQRLSFLRTTEKNLSVLDQSSFEVLKAAIEELHPDVIILDPLVAFCGGGNMNDNTVMSQVMRELKRLAAKFNCAVLIVHHTRKGGDAGNAESISGAAAITNLARRAIMPVPMAENETIKNGVLPSERLSYFKLVDAKSNLAPRSADSPWYQLHSVELPNPEPPLYPHGDNVQAITRVNLPLLNNVSTAGDDLKVRRALLDLVARGKIIDGHSYPYSSSIAGAKNERAILDEATAAVANATAPRQWAPADLEAVTKRTIEKMKDEAWLVVGDMKELMSEPGRFRKGRGLKVDWASTPWPTASTPGCIAAREKT